MSAAALLHEARRVGVTVCMEPPDRLLLTADREPPADLIARIRARKAEVLAALRHGASDVEEQGSPSPDAIVEWLDLDGWCARLGAAGDIHARRAVLREWVVAAGGWSDAAALHLPTSLPRGLALATLKAHARALRLDVRTDHDDPAHLQWLRGGRS